MPAYLHGDETYATKLVAVHPDNPPERPTIHAQILLTDARTGEPAALLAGERITNGNYLGSVMVERGDADAVVVAEAEIVLRAGADGRVRPKPGAVDGVHRLHVDATGVVFSHGRDQLTDQDRVCKRVYPPTVLELLIGDLDEGFGIPGAGAADHVGHDAVFGDQAASESGELIGRRHVEAHRGHGGKVRVRLAHSLDPACRRNHQVVLICEAADQ
jgi:hypothetical protein